MCIYTLDATDPGIFNLSTANTMFCLIILIRVVLDSSDLSTLSTLDRQNSNQVSGNSCAEAVPSTPPSEVVWLE